MYIQTQKQDTMTQGHKDTKTQRHKDTKTQRHKDIHKNAYMKEHALV